MLLFEDPQNSAHGFISSQPCGKGALWIGCQKPHQAYRQEMARVISGLLISIDTLISLYSIYSSLALFLLEPFFV